MATDYTPMDAGTKRYDLKGGSETRDGDRRDCSQPCFQLGYKQLEMSRLSPSFPSYRSTAGDFVLHSATKSTQCFRF